MADSRRPEVSSSGLGLRDGLLPWGLGVAVSPAAGAMALGLAMAVSVAASGCGAMHLVLAGCPFVGGG